MFHIVRFLSGALLAFAYSGIIAFLPQAQVVGRTFVLT
jgi:hypothetical protein